MREYPTSSAFALWLAANILKTGKIPEVSSDKKPRTILIYNHYQIYIIHYTCFCMLNFRNINIIFISVIGRLLLPGFDVYHHLTFWSIYNCSDCIFPSAFLGSYYVGSNFYFKIICSAKTNKKRIAISFDDGPVHEFYPADFAIIERIQCVAAFFCIGKRIQKMKHY